MPSFRAEPHLLIRLQIMLVVFVYIEIWGWMYIWEDNLIYKSFDFVVV